MNIGRTGLVARAVVAALTAMSSVAFANITGAQLNASDTGWSNTIGGDAGANLYLSTDHGTTFINSGDGVSTAINLATTNPGSFTYQFYAYNGYSNSIILSLFTPSGSLAATTGRDTSSTSFTAISNGSTTALDGSRQVTLTGLRFTNSTGPAWHMSVVPGESHDPNIVGEFTYTVTTPVPEPESYALFAAGLGVMGFVARRRRQK